MDRSGVDYCDVFISCLDSHSDGTHSPQRIHWWASDVILLLSTSVSMSKETNVLDGQRVSHLSAYFHFWWTFTITIKSSYALHFCPENVQLNKMVISCFWMHVLSRYIESSTLTYMENAENNKTGKIPQIKSQILVFNIISLWKRWLTCHKNKP